MPNFEETLARMKGLYTYGSELNESKNVNVHTLEHSAKAADGKTYGIIKECNKYYIKAAQKGKENLAEGYEYIGGFCNKGNYEYTSYANALKQFGLKMASINEACDANVNTSSLDPFRANEVLIEGTDKMKQEIARQRQIMYNVSMLMNEGTDIAASRKDDTVMYDGKNPEAPTGKKGDEGGKKASANPKYAGSKTNGVNKKTAPFDQNAIKGADQLKENDGKCEKFGCDWGSEGIGKGKDPKKVGWEMDNQQVVNEEEEDWASKGLPSTPGVGEADTDKNNGPFNKNVNEGCCGEEEDNDFADAESDDMANDTDFDAGIEDVEGTEGAEGEDLGGDDIADAEGEDGFDDEGAQEDFGDEEFSDEDDELGAEGEDLGSEDNDLQAQIDALQAQLDSLKAQLNGGEDADVDGEMDIEFSDDDDVVDDNEFSDDNEDFGGEDDFNAEGEDLGDDGFDAEDGEDFGGEDEFDVEGEDEESFDDDMDECGCAGGNCNMPMNNHMMESKNNRMNSIVESVVRSILAEDELHDFGKHPGYRKKPMELPATGEDKNQWGRDWNDESVHGEEPFGSKIGSSAPFTELVNAVAEKVMFKLSGEAFHGDKKKQ